MLGCAIAFGNGLGVSFCGTDRQVQKWSPHKWVESRGPLARSDLCRQLWGQWLLLGDILLVQWVPSHVGVPGNDHADPNAGRGAKVAKHAVIERKSVTGIWPDLGLQEMPDCYDLDSNVLERSGLSDSDSDSASEELSAWSSRKRQKVSGSHSDSISP